MATVPSRGSIAIAAALLVAPAAVGGQEVVEEETISVASFGKPGFLLSVGSVVDSDEIDDAGRILSTLVERVIRDQSLSPPDRIHVPRVIEGSALEPGDRLLLFRETRKIVDPITEETLGTLLLPTGVAEVEGHEDEVATARVWRGFRPVQVGDRVRRVTRSDTLPPMGGERARPAEGRLVGFQEEKALHPPFDVTFLRDDARELAAGNVVLLFREGETERGRELPEVRLGLAVVVRPGRVAAAVLTRMFRSDLVPGVRYRTTDEEPF